MAQTIEDFPISESIATPAEPTPPASAPEENNFERKLPPPKTDPIEIQQTDAENAVRTSLTLATQHNPDEMAKYQRLARATGYDPLLIAQSPEVKASAEQRAASGQVDPKLLVQRSPGTAKWLSTAINASLAQDDVGALQHVENAMEYVGRSLGSGFLSLDASALVIADSVLSAVGIGTSLPEALVLFKNDKKGFEQWQNGPAGFFSKQAQRLQKESTLFMQDMSESAKKQYGNLEYATLDPRKAAYLTAKFPGDLVRSLPSSMALVFTAYFTRGASLRAAGQAEIKATELGLIGAEKQKFVADAARAAAEKAATATGATGEGAIGAAQQYLQTQEQIASTDISKNPEVEKLVQQGYDPELAALQVKEKAATQAGTIAGVADAAVNFIAGKYIAAFLAPERSATRNVLSGIAVEGTTEGIQSPLEQLGTNLAVKQHIDPTQDLTEGLLESMVQGTLIGSLSGGVFAGTTSYVDRAQTKERDAKLQREMQVRAAYRMQDALIGLEAAVQATKLKERSKEDFKTFMQQMVESTGAKELFVDATKLHEVLTAAPIEEQQMFAQQMPDVVKQITEASVHDGLVSIPIDEYAANVVGTSIGEALLPNVKANPEGLTYAQAKEEVGSETERLVSEQLKKDNMSMDEYQADSQKVYDVLLSRIEGAQRFSPDVNKKYAALQHAYFVTRAARLGIKPSELLTRFPLQVQGVTPAGQTLDQGVPLANLPTKINVDGKEVTFGPFEPAQKAAAEYAKESGIAYTPPSDYVKVDKARAKRIAAAYEEMKNEPNDPQVKAAYDALVKETLAQWKAIEKTGLKVEFFPEGKDTYGNPRNAILDIVNNNHLFIFPTEAGYGMSEADRKDNPMLQPVEGVTFGGKPVLVNDLFRAVHDYFGHAKEGIGFRADGEENAWRMHSAMFSPLAQRALTTETRGQNSWLNFGPHAEHNKTASGADTIYAEQKIGLLPEWVSNAGVTGPETQTSSQYGYRARDAARKATIDDFTADNVKDILRKTDWAVLTAENPNAEAMPPEENAARNADLKADLDALGVDYIEVNGKYGGNEEHSFAVTGITREQALALGEKYGQQSVLTRDGFVYQDGSVNPAKGVNTYAKAPSDFYSTIPATNTHFAVDIDFNTKVTLTDESRVGETTIDATHFSRAPRAALNGTNYGTGIKGAESQRLADPVADPRIKTRIAFYVDEGKGTQPEAGVGPFRHDLTLTNMYDGARNPLHFPKDPNAFEKSVVDAGFDGYYIRQGFGQQGAAVLLGEAAKNVEVDTPPKGVYNQQMLQTDTPEFKKWFGNSKVVDADGKPLVVYHGGIVQGTEGIAEFHSGTHFGNTQQANEALTFSMKEQKKEEAQTGGEIEGYELTQSVTPVYLKIENPKRVKDVGKEWKREIERAKREGYDGLVYANRYEGTIDGEPSGDSWIIFRPTQVKSAIGNRGTFDASNPNILYQSALNEIYDNQHPVGELSQQDLADLRKMWNLYAAAGMEATQYDNSKAKAADLSQAGIFNNLQQIFADVFAVTPETAPLVQDITRFREGTHPQVPSGSFAYRVMSGKRMAEVYIDPSDKSMQMNILNWGEGGGGAAVYKALLDFAHNNGFVFFGDTQGISVAAIKRRLENLLSHALQTGDTSYMQLHPKQISFIEQETGVKIKWTSNSQNNIEQMLNASYNLTNLDIPELKDVYFDFIQQTFVDARTGGAVADINGYVAKARRNPDAVRREGAAGFTTAARTAFSNTLLRAKSAEARRLVFDSMARLSLGELSGAERLLYQSGIEEQPAFYSALTQALETHQQKKGTPDQWIGIIKNLTQKGIKPEEIEYTGLLDWLEQRKSKQDSQQLVDGTGFVVAQKPLTDPAYTQEDIPQPGGSIRTYRPSKEVTREEILGFLRDEGSIEVTPRVYGGEDNPYLEFDFNMGQFDFDPPDQGMLEERAADDLFYASFEDLQSYARDAAPEDIEALRQKLQEPYSAFLEWRRQEGPLQSLYEDILRTRTEFEENNYYTDSESPSSRDIRVKISDGQSFDFTQQTAYGESYLYYKNDNGDWSEVWSGTEREGDDAVITEAIERFLADEYSLYRGDESNEDSAKFSRWTLIGGPNYRERLLLNKSHKSHAFLYTNHFDDENIIGFTRVSDTTVGADLLQDEFPDLAKRLAAEGRRAKVYFIEEIQSDWAQQGREHPEIIRKYKDGELYIDEAASEGNPEILKNLEVRAHTSSTDGSTMYHVYNNETGETMPYSISDSKEVAEKARLAMADADYWIIRDVFDSAHTYRALKVRFPTREQALIYVQNNWQARLTSELTKFGASDHVRKLVVEKDALARKRIELTGKQREIDDPIEEEKISAERTELSSKIRALQDEIDRYSQRISKGPFVTSTDSWVSLLLKDAIHEATKGGYDIISWTTGDQQTQRWSSGLRDRVDTIQWLKDTDGKIHIKALKNKAVRADTKYGENDLSAAIGKTMAKQIIEDPNQSGEIKGYDIVVADLGMVKFYGDQYGNNPDGKPAIVTKVANNVLKKLGGGNVKNMNTNRGAWQAVAQNGDVTITRDYGEMRTLRSQGWKIIDLNEEKGGPSDKEFGNQPAFEITPKLREIASQGLPLFQKNRGTFAPDSSTISLLENADLSTFLHESGHFFLEAESSLAADPSTPQDVKDDFNKILNWLGIKDLATWQNMSFEEKRPYHEKYARGFEAYLFEGKAPSAELRSIFSAFKAWLIYLYRSLTNLNVELSDDVRGVFDRMLASDEQITMAENRRAYSTAEIADMTPSEHAAYLALDGDASAAAMTDMERRSMRDMQWLSKARAKVQRQLSNEAASKRKEIRSEVTAEVMAEPINQARTFLRKGETTAPNGDLIKAEKGFRLDKAALEDMYPETMLARPDLTQLRGMTAPEGLHPDLVAEMFGFPSGDALVRELIDGENTKDKIEGLTDQRMLERYGELSSPQAIADAADAAIHNEARARFMATGLKALTDTKLTVQQLMIAATEAADQIIAEKKIRDLKTAPYAAAETKANKEVLKYAAKDVEKAKRAQRSALLNNRLVKGTQDALEDVRKGLERVKRIQKAAAQKNMRGEYLAQLNALMDRFDMRKSTTLKSIDSNRTPLAEWLANESERMSAVMPDIPAWILNEGNRISYKNMTTAEFRGLMDTIKQLETMARREEKQYQEIRGMKFKEERKAVLDRIRKFHPEAFDLNGEPKGLLREFTKVIGDKAPGISDKLYGEFLNAETILNILEGGEFGLVHESLFGRMSKRADWKAERLGALFKEMQPYFDYTLKERYDFAHKDIGAPVGISLTRENAMVVALLHGNKEGRERLANYGWSEGTQQAIVNLLDEKDMALVAKIWDVFDNNLWPELRDLNERTRGKAPPKVEAVEVKHKGKTYRGGYFRLKYDTDLDERAHRLDEGAAVKELLGGGLGMSAKTGQGASTERKQNVTMRPRLDLAVFSEAVNETVHDLAYREAVADTMRMLNDVRIQNTIKTAAGIPAYRALVTRVREIAAPPRNPSGFIEKSLTLARKNTIITLMSGVNTALQNFTGFASSLARFDNPGLLAREIGKFYGPKMMERYDFAVTNSTYMKNRYHSFERDLQNEANKLQVGTNVMPDMGTFLILMQWVDKGTSVPVWNAAYAEGMAKFKNDHSKSVDYADHIVRQSQGSGREIDVAQIMSGHGGWGALKKVFTMFYSYFNAQLGMLVRSGAVNKQLAKTNPSLAAARFTRDFMFIYVMPAVLTAMLFKRGNDGLDDPDKWLHKYLYALAMYGMAMVPLVRDIGSFAWASFDKDVNNYGMKLSPVQAAPEGVVKGLVALKNIAAGEGTDRDLKNLIMGTSFAVGLPGNLIQQTTRGTIDWLEGNAPPTAVVFGPEKK